MNIFGRLGFVFQSPCTILFFNFCKVLDCGPEDFGAFWGRSDERVNNIPICIQHHNRGAHFPWFRAAVDIPRRLYPGCQWFINRSRTHAHVAGTRTRPSGRSFLHLLSGGNNRVSQEFNPKLKLTGPTSFLHINSKT